MLSHWQTTSYAPSEEEQRRTADRKREQQQAAERESVRQAEYQRAEQAAILAGATVTSELRMHLRHVVDLAMVEPRVTISWMAPGSRARKLTAGRSLNPRRTIITPSVRDLRHGGLDDIATALHELAHQRDPEITQRSRCEREVFAWRWVLAHTLSWDRPTHTAMVRSILTYADSEKRDVLGVQCVEAFVAEPFEQYARTLAREQVETFEDGQFIREHGEQQCQCGQHCHARNAPAVVIDAGRHVCRACRQVLETERRIREQRREVAAMQAPPATALDRRILAQRREYYQRRPQRRQAQPGRYVAASPRPDDQQAFRQTIEALTNRVRAGHEPCAACGGTAASVRKEFGADGPTTDVYRALCEQCLVPDTPAGRAFIVKQELVKQWRSRK